MNEIKIGYNVYVQINSNNDITAINSEAFINDYNNWLLLEVNVQGDKGHHAQNNYFDKPLITEYGIYRYKWINNQIYEKTDEEIANEESIIQSNISRLNQIKELKQNLFDTDYVIIKMAEGVATINEYADVIAQRQAWREEINLLESI